MSADNTSREALGEVMSENARTVIARAREEAEGRWPPSDGWQDVRRIWTDGATFAATITPEQVEAAAQELQTSEYLLGRIAGIVWCRQRARAVLIAAGFEVAE